MSLQTLDLLLRAATVALALAMAVALVLRPNRNVTALLAAFVVGGIAAFMIASAPGAHNALGLGAFFFNGWCLATPGVVWMLALQLFGEGRGPSITHVAGVGVLVAVTMAGDYGRFRLGPLAADPELAYWMLLAGRAVSIALLFAACGLAVVHWRADLVEQRRRVRAGFVALFGTAFVALASSTFIFGPEGAPIEILIAGHCALLAFTFALLQYFIRGGMSELVTEDPHLVRVPLTVVRSDAAEAALAQRVLEAMAASRLWKREGLGIADLAQELRTQEHRLRRAINRHLGYRNFNEFLHHYRLEEAAARLSDPAEKHLPVLTIALDCGYGSIGPFNRAFKSRFGVTPTQYRDLRTESLRRFVIPR